MLLYFHATWNLILENMLPALAGYLKIFVTRPQQAPSCSHTSHLTVFCLYSTVFRSVSVLLLCFFFIRDISQQEAPDSCRRMSTQVRSLLCAFFVLYSLERLLSLYTQARNLSRVFQLAAPCSITTTLSSPFVLRESE